jgi:hypothetical protein
MGPCESGTSQPGRVRSAPTSDTWQQICYWTAGDLEDHLGNHLDNFVAEVRIHLVLSPFIPLATMQRWALEIAFACIMSWHFG